MELNTALNQEFLVELEAVVQTVTEQTLVDQVMLEAILPLKEGMVAQVEALVLEQLLLLME